MIFKFYLFAKLLQFSTTTTCSNDYSIKLYDNNCTAMKVTGYPYCWVVSHLDNGIKTGTHVFRFNIDNKPKTDILWGISPYNKTVRPESYDSKYVHGWYNCGGTCFGGQFPNLPAHQHTFHGKNRYLLLDIKLDCDKRTLSFKTLLVDKKINHHVIGREYVCYDLSLNITKLYGWVPHFLMCDANASISICEIDPKMYGVRWHEIDNKLFPKLPN